MQAAGKRLITAFCVFGAVGAAVSAPTHHDRQSVATVTAATLNEISTWLVENFDLAAPDELPQVKFAASAWLSTVRYRRLLPGPLRDAASADSVEPGKDIDVVAVYDDATGTVYLGDGWRGESPAEMSVLVHEMVHHLQNRAQSRFSCPQEREMLAYAAQDRWLALFGGSLETKFGIDPLTLLLRTKCMGW